MASKVSLLIKKTFVAPAAHSSSSISHRSARRIRGEGGPRDLRGKGVAVRFVGSGNEPSPGHAKIFRRAVKRNDRWEGGGGGASVDRNRNRDERGGGGGGGKEKERKAVYRTQAALMVVVENVFLGSVAEEWKERGKRETGAYPDDDDGCTHCPS